eukprot:TRINITY_DN8705_c0_g1_i4.p1 TRINITY_DN8705_c0_g1~~TRINITY_DN8705_c0_g1_i4.p1  ORF type:complete len:313 (+),score=50.79 TRINITY_DN8705_c0_g1_i4:101-1039(+)
MEGRILCSEKRFSEAAQKFSEALKLLEDFPEYDEEKKLFCVLGWKGFSLDEAGDHEAAIECYERVLSLHQNELTWYNKGCSLRDLKRYDEELECYDMALIINPSSNHAWNNRAAVLNRKGKYSEALESVEKALVVGNTAKDSANPWSHKGTALNGLGRRAEALKCLDKALKINPLYPTGWFNKGQALLSMGNFDEAVRCFEQALCLDSFHSDARDGLEDTRILIGNQSLMNAALYADYCISIDGSSYQCHRFVMLARCPKLLLEDQLPNFITASAFEKFLDYLYNGFFPNWDPEQVGDVIDFLLCLDHFCDK